MSEKVPVARVFFCFSTMVQRKTKKRKRLLTALSAFFLGLSSRLRSESGISEAEFLTEEGLKEGSASWRRCGVEQ